MGLRYEFASPEFDEAVRESGRRAFKATLAAGRPAFYLDDSGLNLMELPDGSKFEIQWIPGAPSGSNYEVIRELKR